MESKKYLVMGILVVSLFCLQIKTLGANVQETKAATKFINQHSQLINHQESPEVDRKSESPHHNSSPPIPYRSRDSVSDTTGVEPTWWIKSLFTGLISALVIILAFVLNVGREKEKEKKRKREFVHSACIELKRILVQLVNNVLKFKTSLGKLDSEMVKWHQQAFLEFDLSDAGDPTGQTLPIPEEGKTPISDERAAEIANMLNERKKGHEDEFLRLTELEVGFIENNLPLISMIGLKDQRLLFSVIRRLHIINSWIAQLEDEYQRSFEYGTDKTLSDKIARNRDRYYVKISRYMRLVANEIMDFCKTATSKI